MEVSPHALKPLTLFVNDINSLWPVETLDILQLSLVIFNITMNTLSAKGVYRRTCSSKESRCPVMESEDLNLLSIRLLNQTNMKNSELITPKLSLITAFWVRKVQLGILLAFTILRTFFTGYTLGLHFFCPFDLVMEAINNANLDGLN